ncbi:uncharacterized protein [Panulirus ornatus]|uniref:uncharacterized protein n=1 Tax=Panulirus ornatus TaxID=150431 RepID=UPI003A85179D
MSSVSSDDFFDDEASKSDPGKDNNNTLDPREESDTESRGPSEAESCSPSEAESCSPSEAESRSPSEAESRDPSDDVNQRPSNTVSRSPSEAEISHVCVEEKGSLKFSWECQELEDEEHESIDIGEDVNEEIVATESECDDEEENDNGHNESHDGSEELERLFTRSQSILSTTSSAAKFSRQRPSSASPTMRALTRSPHTASSSSPRLGSDEARNGGPAVRSSSRLLTAGQDPSLLLVSKSPVHDRPAPNRVARDASPKPACDTKTPTLTTNNKGINRVLRSKEQSSEVRPSSAGSWRTSRKSGVIQPRIMDRRSVCEQQPSQRPLGKYTRSLKMLGVRIPSPAPKDHRAPRSSSSQSWESAGKLQTRLSCRSTSLEDVSRAIPQVKTPHALHTLTVDENQRATLSQAVYEEWYFRRCQEIRSHKIRAREKVIEERNKKEKEQKDLEKKVNTAVSDWKEKKRGQNKKTKEKLMKEAQKNENKEKEKDKKQERVTAALIAWEAEKNELARKKREKKKKEIEADKEKERVKASKKEDSKMGFLLWKQQKDEEEKERRRKKKQEEEEQKMKKAREMMEKRRDGELAFVAWKKKKLREQGEDMRRIIIKSELEKSSDAQRRLHRSSEALQAYEAWLEEVEERQPRRLHETARASLLARIRPPWWPGGSSSSLLRCSYPTYLSTSTYHEA